MASPFPDALRPYTALNLVTTQYRNVCLADNQIIPLFSMEGCLTNADFNFPLSQNGLFRINRFFPVDAFGRPFHVIPQRSNAQPNGPSAQRCRSEAFLKGNTGQFSGFMNQFSYYPGQNPDGIATMNLLPLSNMYVGSIHITGESEDIVQFDFLLENFDEQISDQEKVLLQGLIREAGNNYSATASRQMLEWRMCEPPQGEGYSSQWFNQTLEALIGRGLIDVIREQPGPDDTLLVSHRIWRYAFADMDGKQQPQHWAR